MLREIPPTAGLPLTFGDFLYRAQSDELERRLASFLTMPSIQIECSGTASLVVALTALRKLRAREVVIVQGYTCPLVAIAIAQAGLRCRVVDTDESCAGYDMVTLKSALRDDVLAVIVTDMGGIPCDLDAVQRLASQYGAYVIEDAAQSLGATRNGIVAGTTSDIGMFSLTLGKGLTIYQGGFLCANSPAITAALMEAGKQLRRTDSTLELVRIAQLIGCAGLYNPLGCALAYGIPLRRALAANNFDTACGDVFDSQAEVVSVGSARKGVGASAARRLPQFIAENRDRARKRLELLRGQDVFRVVEPISSDEGSWPFFTLVFGSQTECEQALTQLWGRGLGVTKLFSRALTDYEYLRPLIAEPSETPHARSFAARSLTVSNSQWLEDNDIQVILGAISKNRTYA